MNAAERCFEYPEMRLATSNLASKDSAPQIISSSFAHLSPAPDCPDKARKRCFTQVVDGRNGLFRDKRIG